LVASNSAWKNEDITISSFHLKSVIVPPLTLGDDVPAYITTLFAINLSAEVLCPTPPLHLAAVEASSQTTKPAEFAISAVVYTGKLTPSLAGVN